MRLTLSRINAVLAPLRDRLAVVRAAAARAAEVEAPQFNVFHFLRPDEILLSDILGDLLDPNGSHGQGPLFLRRVFRAVGITPGVPPNGGVRVRREDGTTHLAAGRRIDLTIEVGATGVAIENKPWAGDQPEQMADYARHMRAKYGDRGFHLIYLSGAGELHRTASGRRAGASRNRTATSTC